MNNRISSIFLLFNEFLSFNLQILFGLNRHIKDFTSVILVWSELWKNLFIQPWSINIVKFSLERQSEESLFLQNSVCVVFQIF